MIDRLLREPRRFGFFQAVRLLDRERRRRNARGAEPGDKEELEVARFSVEPSLAFPGSEIAEIRRADGKVGQRHYLVEMVVSFFGLTGPSGVLPQHYTSRLLILRARSRALRDFLDLFNHRLISLFAQTWFKYRLPIAYEHSPRATEDPITTTLWATVGLLGDQSGVASIRDRWVLFYAGMFAHTVRSAVGLERMLQEYLRLTVIVEQFRGRWLFLGADECTALPFGSNPRGGYCQLGETATLGDRVWDIQSCFLIVIGPVDYSAFYRLMPTGNDLPRLAELVRLYVGRSLDFDVQLVLRRDQVPPCQMAESDDFKPLLGWNTWLPCDARTEDASDAIFAGDAILETK